MAVLAGIYGNAVPKYEGCVLSTYEHNGYEDSDWYAVVWDEETQCVTEVEYDTTRAAGGGWAKIDATPEVLLKVYRYYKNIGKSLFDKRTNQEQAKKVRKGDTVTVIRGRKVPKGTTGIVFWVGKKYNYYSHHDEDRVGIEVDGERQFLPLEYVQVNDWEERLIRGKERKRKIRNFAVNSMPAHYRKYFAGPNFSMAKKYFCKS